MKKFVVAILVIGLLFAVFNAFSDGGGGGGDGGDGGDGGAAEAPEADPPAAPGYSTRSWQNTRISALGKCSVSIMVQPACATLHAGSLCNGDLYCSGGGNCGWDGDVCMELKPGTGPQWDLSNLDPELVEEYNGAGTGG